MNWRYLRSSLVTSALMLGTALIAAHGAPKEKPRVSPSAPGQEPIKPLKQQCMDKKEGGEYREALTACQQLVDALEGKPKSHGELATALNALGEVLRNQGDLAKAEPVLRRSLQIRERLLGRNHPAIAESLDNLALVAQDRGDYSQAETLFLRDLKICERARGPKHFDVANALVCPAESAAPRDPGGTGSLSALLRPLARAPAGNSPPVLSPDRIFNLVPFAALHDGRDYLLGQFQFRYLTSGRDLLRSPVPNRPQSPLILADPDFQAISAHPLSADGVTSAESSSSGSLYLQIQGLQRLPATRTEAAALQTLFGVAPLLDARATEDAVHGAQAPIILHIASHGALLTEGSPQTELAAVSPAIRRGTAPGSAPDALPASELDGGTTSRSALLMANSERTTPARPLVATPDASSLSRSAVLLAGAEHAARAADPGHDGLLTAEEVRSMNLWGTQLVVLSACETGRGALSIGQGIYGLRRSFLVAGAETLVTSLWSVSDRATGELMISFYNKLVREKKKRVEAMEEAMKEMKNQRPHPYYWAPFIVLGQDGPLRTFTPSGAPAHAR